LILLAFGLPGCICGVHHSVSDLPFRLPFLTREWSLCVDVIKGLLLDLEFLDFFEPAGLVLKADFLPLCSFCLELLLLFLGEARPLSSDGLLAFGS